jgi:hypothetical protein
MLMLLLLLSFGSWPEQCLLNWPSFKNRCSSLACTEGKASAHGTQIEVYFNSPVPSLSWAWAITFAWNCNRAWISCNRLVQEIRAPDYVNDLVLGCGNDKGCVVWQPIREGGLPIPVFPQNITPVLTSYAGGTQIGTSIIHLILWLFNNAVSRAEFM